MENRSAQILVDSSLNPVEGDMTVILNTAQVAAKPKRYPGQLPAGSKVSVQRTAEGAAYVEIGAMQPSEVLVLANHAEDDEGAVAG
jgi:hypothetical protein